MTERDRMVWHLQHNIYPPVTPLMANAAMAALDAVRGGFPDVPIHVGCGDKAAVLDAATIYNDLRLDTFGTDDEPTKTDATRERAAYLYGRLKAAADRKCRLYDTEYYDDVQPVLAFLKHLGGVD